MSDMTVTSRRALRAGRRVSGDAQAMRGARAGRWAGWLFLAPALIAYSVFVLWPLVTSFRYSLYSWDGGSKAKWVGLDNYKSVFSDPTLLSVLGHSGQLIIYFCLVPVSLGLIVAAIMRRV